MEEPGNASDTGIPHACAPVVPDGYLLTTTELRYRYIADEERCSEAPHQHPEHILAWPAWGTAELDVENARWRVALGEGVWLPAGTVHQASRAIDTALCVTHVTPEAWTEEILEPRAVAVNTALREMLLYLSVSPISREKRVRGQQVCLEMITDADAPAIQVPVVRDARIAHIAEAIMRNPADDRSLEVWARRSSMSTRTIARAFSADTGTTFSEWRSTVRMFRAVDLLGNGMPVSQVARAVGYSSASAFSAAFRRALGRAPQTLLPKSGASVRPNR